MMNCLTEFRKKHGRIRDYLCAPLTRLKSRFNRCLRLKAVKLKLEEVSRKNEVESAQINYRPDVFLMSSYRVESDDRQEIFNVAMRQNLKNLSGTNLTFRAVDSSDDEYSAINTESLKAIADLRYDIQRKKEKLTEAYLSILRDAKEKYFCCLFDDMPIIGPNYDFFRSACQLLDDFHGLVDIVSIEHTTDFTIDDVNKNIVFNDTRAKKVGSVFLGVVKYGSYSFAILPNQKYGFFFNTMVARRADYLRRLEWYMSNISSVSPHTIELAGMRGRGPVFSFVAIPLECNAVDMDYIHSNISIREVYRTAPGLFAAFSKNYEPIFQPNNFVK